MSRIILALALSVLPLAAAAQVTTFNVKPPVALWQYPEDVSAVEIRVRGRLSTDSTATHRIIGRIPLKTFDLSLVTLRVTILVPTTQTWEVKSLGLFVVPAPATGLASVELLSRNLATFHIAPAGKQLAIDLGPKTGVVTLGPVGSTPTPPPVTGASKPGDSMPPLARLTATDGAVWILMIGSVFRNGADTRNPYSPNIAKIYVSETSTIRSLNSDGTYACWTGTAWAGSGC